MKKLLAALAAIPLLAACAVAPPSTGLASVSTPDAASPAPAPPQPAASGSATPSATPTPTPEPIDTTIGLRRPTYPEHPRPVLTAAQEAKYGGVPGHHGVELVEG